MDFVQYHEEPVKLSSGRLSHWFVDGRAIFESPPHRELVLAFWERRVAFDRYDHYPWHLVPVPTGGNRWAEALADRVGASWGEEIPVQNIERIAVIEDVVTTGASAHRMVMGVQEASGRVSQLGVPVLAVVRRSGSVPGLNVLACFRMELPDFEAS